MSKLKVKPTLEINTSSPKSGGSSPKSGGISPASAGSSSSHPRKKKKKNKKGEEEKVIDENLGENFLKSKWRKPT